MIVGDVKTCRVCGREFFPEPLVHYANMPGSAQGFPDRETLAGDRGTSLEVCQCSGCGLVQLSSEPVSYFREVIRAAGISDAMGTFRRHQFAAFVQDHSLQGKDIVEIGCGGGEYLALMAELPVRACGVEFSRKLAMQSTEAGLEVAQGFVENRDYRIPGGPFDAFFMLSFLEHLPEPNDTLQGIHSNLSDEGVGIVEVPNFDMILQENLFAEFIADHLTYFTRETLETTLSLNGFEVLDCREVWHNYILSAQVRKRPRKDIGAFSEFQARLQGDIDAFIREYGAGNVAVWGAGHQALAIMSLLRLGGRIRYVVDSAPFKQDRFTPATHIPIVPPRRLEDDPVQAVIVMAGSYSDEVVAILRQQYSPAIRIAVLRPDGLEHF